MLIPASPPPLPEGGGIIRLLELTLALNSTEDLDALLALIIQSTQEVLGCEEASILLFDEDRGDLYFAAASGAAAGKLVSLAVPLDSLAGTIYRQNTPVATFDAQADARHYQAVGQAVGFVTRSLLGVPMRIDGKPVGVLEALNKRGGAFTDADTELLTVLAAQAAVALRNARQATALREAYANVERANEMKTNLIAIASHELRTPLSAILAFSEVLQDHVRDESRAFVAEVLDAARRMHRVVDAMTALMDVLGRRSDLHRLDLGPEIAAAVADDAWQGRTVRLDLPDHVVEINGDAGQLQAAVRNLIENAAAFSAPEAPIHVRVFMRENQAFVEVEDQGIGIPPDHRERVFEPFYQVEHYLTRTHGGLGIGLTYVREVARRHFGVAEAADGQDGAGTTFRLRLPLAGVPSAPR